MATAPKFRIDVDIHNLNSPGSQSGLLLQRRPRHQIRLDAIGKEPHEGRSPQF
jgi:hypothetical protein